MSALEEAIDKDRFETVAEWIKFEDELYQD